MATLQLGFDDEVRLVDRAAAGEGEARAELYNRYCRYIYRVALRLTGREEDAEDVRQETFLKAFRHLRGFRRGARFSTWLTQIARNESFTKLRERRGGRMLSLDDPESAAAESFEQARPQRNAAINLVNANIADPEEHFHRREVRARLRDVFAALDPAFLAVFLLRAVEKRSTRQVARELGISSSAVKSRLFRSRARLRDRLGAPMNFHFGRRGRTGKSATRPTSLPGNAAPETRPS